MTVIKKDRMNKSKSTLHESVGSTYSDWLDLNQGPEAGDELVTAWIDNFESAAEILKCSVNDLVNITEDDDEVAYNKIIKKIVKGDKGKSVELPMVDGKAGLFTLTDGTTVITTNEWGYGTVFVRESDLKKVMNESVRMSESAKISKMTKIDGLAFSGLWHLPSGVPGLVAGIEDLELVVVGNEEGIDLLLQGEDGEGWYKFYPADKEKEAVAEFKKIAALMTDFVDTSKLAKKFGLKGSGGPERMSESYSDRDKLVIYDLWFENLEKVMGYSKQVADGLRKSKYDYEAYTDKTYDMWKSLLVKAGVKIPSIVSESRSFIKESVDISAVKRLLGVTEDNETVSDFRYDDDLSKLKKDLKALGMKKVGIIPAKYGFKDSLYAYDGTGPYNSEFSLEVSPLKNDREYEIKFSSMNRRVNESASGRWAQVDLHAEDEYKYCGNGGRSWVTADSGHVDTWDSKEAAIADGKKNYSKDYKFGRDWDVVQFQSTEKGGYYGH